MHISISPAASATPPPVATSAIDAVVDRALQRQRLVGAMLLVACNGQTVYRRAAGLADREAGRPMTEDTLFRLASVSKPIVSAAALVLVGQGRLDLDDPVDRWLPQFRPALPGQTPARLTVRQLLTHTAGLGYRFLETDRTGPLARAGVSDGLDGARLTLAENLRRIAGVPLLYAPGTAWGYSLAIDVLGGVIESVTGQALPNAVRALVTQPLGLHDTGFHTSDAQRLATAYVNDDPAPHRLRSGETVTPFEGAVGIEFDPARALDPTAFASGGAGMVGSAGDFLRLLETLRTGGGPLFPPALVAEMGRNQTGDKGPPDAPGTGFGLGFSVLHDPQAAASPESPGTWRWGGAYGHSWFVDPPRRLSVVAFTNTLYEGMSGDFVHALRDAVYASLGRMGGTP
ncbi:serine hydrolase domain-containing protein [Variovorax ginsengisoli]|uniref:CubicO group peptidase (Beta-lactamase class C family) n=1 Tax=Variovorax ginsengisoli TaxID=363844 RepID=A0ABT9SB03_9BURK|nr:serine hydrolase domain-containing protein [Variovorax ginsengisoli]MDP9901540.1 CubicO group peptidase (beta-lactamase class C family) [Variovorax ginsengisoli]